MRPNLPSLLSGIAVMAVGIVLLLDRLGDVDLDLGSAGPMLLGLLGIVLVVSGLARQERG